MNQDDMLRAVGLAAAEASKAKLTGQLIVTLSYQDGGLTKAFKEVHGPLMPGAKVPTGMDRHFDRPGQNKG